MEEMTRNRKGWKKWMKGQITRLKTPTLRLGITSIIEEEKEGERILSKPTKIFLNLPIFYRLSVSSSK